MSNLILQNSKLDQLAEGIEIILDLEYWLN